ncbi:MAG: hypothetical protein K6A63_05765 [Acholeplasmatales bacterium]|nr:hypothetical protein [Acholeplasmatales bacterium]
MRKKYLLIGVTAIAALSLASCGGSNSTSKNTNTSKNSTGSSTATSQTYTAAPNAPTYTSDAGEVDVLLNYSGTAGVTRVSSEAFQDPITGETITQGTLLPTWKAFASYTKTTIVEASSYAQSSDSAVWQDVTTNKFVNQNDSSRKVDLLYNATSNFKSNSSSLVNLSNYLGQMPNFSAWLAKNPTMARAITIDGGIYYTPYFDGYNDVERMFIMDTSMVKLVLDSTEGWDTTTTNGGTAPSSNVLQGGFYQPFVNADYNYPDATTKVPVLVNGESVEATINQTENIIKKQNALLATGCTGKELAEQLIDYITTAHSLSFVKGYYTNPSDLYISSAAAYNTDELIALMRVIKANPGLITGDSSAEVETFFPRAASNNRIENILDFAQVWGVQGVDSEQNNFYFAGDKKLHALETTQASYDALNYLSEMYDEGLIVGDFYTDAKDSKRSTGMLDRYYKKTLTDSGYGFMMYDYSAATIAANDIYNGIGTAASAREKDKFDTNYSQTSITAVLPPLTYWATEDTWDHTQAINNFTGKTLNRYYESNRALKSTTWAIPATSDNIEGAVRLMDFMFSSFGKLVQDYGPTAYWAKPGDIDTVVDGQGNPTSYDSSKAYVSTSLVVGEYNAILSDAISLQLAASGSDFWTYSRNYLGSTHGVGYVRTKGINLQATNYYGQWGVQNVQTAFNTDTVLKLAQIDKFESYTWDTCAPTGFVSIHKDSNYIYDAITGFWGATKKDSNNGWVNVVISDHTADSSSYNIITGQKEKTSYSTVLDQMSVFNKNALYTYAISVGAAYVPSYATAA